MTAAPSSLVASVVVPTFERRASMLRLCTALSLQTLPGATFELIVSVDGSSDGTAEALASLKMPYPLRILTQAKGGRASALNAGIRAACGELLVLLDDDMEPSPEFLERHVGAHADRASCGVMGAVPIVSDAEAPSAARYTAAKFNGHLEQLRRPEYVMRLTDFYSGNFSIRRSAMIDAGGFDEDFQVYGNEDLELSWRLSKAGIRMVYEPRALARQYNDKTFAALARDSRDEGRTAVLFARKHPEAFDQLRLGTFHNGSRLLRALRNALLSATRNWPSLPERIVGLERMIARWQRGDMTAFYRLALGYFYWLGARTALQDSDARVNDTAGLRRLAGELSA